MENGAKVQIDTAHLSDAGSYTCQMSNVAGQVNLTYQLDVFSKEIMGEVDEMIIEVCFYSTTDDWSIKFSRNLSSESQSNSSTGMPDGWKA